jgi:fumarate reductase flavoprotein subunit
MWDAETDVLVVGAGGCGLAAALAARDRDVRVTLLEKESTIGGATAMSGGSILGADTRTQREAGIDDTPGALAEDILDHAVGEANPDVVHALATEARRTIHWLEDDLGLSLSVNTGPYGRHGHRVPRRHWLDADEGIHRSGEQLIAELLAAATDRGVEVLTDHPVRDLVVEDGQVVGVLAGKRDTERIRAGAVILATGGFGNDPEMLAEFAPDGADLLYWGDEGSTGDGIRAGRAAGAEAANMTAYLGFPTISVPERVFVPWETTKEGAFVVDETGRRFADAGACAYSEFTAAMVDHDADRFFLCFDRPVFAAMASQPSTADRWANCVDHDVFVSAETPAALAARLGIDADGLAATAEALESVASPGETASDDHTRQIAGPLAPPLYGTEITPAILQTQGGLRVDDRARVLDAEGEPIPNLYAGGGAATSVSGSDPTGYLSGNGLLTALNLGRIAGRDAAETLGADRSQA